MAAFDRATLDQLAEGEEIDIETRAPDGAEPRRTTIWVAVDGEDVFVRSIHGTRGRWYRDLRANPEGAIHLLDGGQTPPIPVRAVPAADPESVERATRAFERKYAGDAALRTVVAAETFPSTLRLEPAQRP